MTKSSTIRNGTCGLAWIKRVQRPTEPDREADDIRLIDLFCGCGGLTLGAREGARIHRRTLQIRFAVDINKTTVQLYRKNLTGNGKQACVDDVARIFAGKIKAARTSTERYWAKKIGDVDLLVAGPPCQGHSDLNNSTRRNDPRNQLYLRVIRACRVLKPLAAIIENVPTIVHDRTNVVDKAKAELVTLGYHISDGVIHLGRFGVPQNRKRHVLLATLEQTIALDEIKALSSVTPSIDNYLQGLEDEPKVRNGLFYQPARITQTNQERIDYLFDNNLHNLPNELRPSCHRDKTHSYVSMYGRMYPQKPAQTLTSGFGSMGQGRYVHPTRRRLVTPHEAARLQGFPDFFTFSDVKTVTKLRALIANAVPPQFAAVVVSHLIQRGVL